MGGIAKIDQEYAQLEDRMESLVMDVEDVASILGDMSESLYFDENEAQETEDRLDVIRALKRKYGANKAEIDLYFNKITEEQLKFNYDKICETYSRTVLADKFINFIEN